MSFIPPRKRPAQSPRASRVVLAVGRRVFVHGPSDGTRPVLLTDENGLPATAGLRDGVEVEVLAWRPRGSAGTRYRVCDRADGVDGWLSADELRTTSARPAIEPVAAAVAPTAPRFADYRPFGSRS